MATIKGFSNYGVFAREKQTIFTIASAHVYAKVSENVEITLPDGWSTSKNVFGQLLIDTPDGITYVADEIISSYGDEPVLSWYDGKKRNRIKLEWREI